METQVKSRVLRLNTVIQETAVFVAGGSNASQSKASKEFKTFISCSALELNYIAIFYAAE
jgi:hypothetical protein